MLAADLNHRRSRRACEPAGVHRTQPRPPAYRDRNDRPVTRSDTQPVQRLLAVGRRLDERHVAVALDWTNRSGDTASAGKRTVEHRQAVDARSVELNER